MDGLRSDTGSEVRTGSDSGGGGIFLKSVGGGVGEGAIGSNSCRSGAGPSNVVEKATGIHFLKMSSFSIEVSMVLVISLKLVALRLPGHSSGEVFAGDGAGLRSGGGLGVGTTMSLLGGGSVPGLSRGSSEGGSLRSGSGSGGGGSGSESGGGIFLKSVGGVGKGAIGSNSCRSGAAPSNVVEKVTGVHFLKMSSFSIEVSMVLVISLKLVAPRLPGHSSGDVFAGNGTGLRSGGRLVGGSASGLIRDGAGSDGGSWSGGMLGLDSDDGAGGGADLRSVVGESGSAIVTLTVVAVFGSNSEAVL